MAVKKILVLVALLAGFAAYAQKEENFALYLSSDLAIGNCGDCFGGGLHGNFIWKETISFQLAYTSYHRKAKSTPDDYRSSNFLDRNVIPTDRTSNVQLLAGKVFVLNTNGTLRFNLMGGIGYSRVRTPTNWQRDVVNSWLGYRNYSYDKKTSSHASFILNPKFEIPFSRGYGLSFAGVFVANSEGVWFGFTIGQMIGLVRKRKPSKITEAGN